MHVSNKIIIVVYAGGFKTDIIFFSLPLFLVLIEVIPTNFSIDPITDSNMIHILKLLIQESLPIWYHFNV